MYEQDTVTTVVEGEATLVRRSQTIASLAGALSKAQAEIEGASKDKVNPHFKAKYADLASIWDSARGPLSKHGLAVCQMPSADGARVTVTTLLLHSSGEWIESDLTMTAGQNTPQAVGSAITYARRYALAAAVGVAPEDDDAEGATNRNDRSSDPRQPAPREVTAPQGFQGWYDDLTACASEGTAKLQAMWAASKLDFRQHLTATNPNGWNNIKAKAATVKGSAA